MESPGRSLPIRVGEPRRITLPGVRHWFPELYVMPDGAILEYDCNCADAIDALAQPDTTTARRSSDGGEAWSECAAPGHYGFLATLSDRHVRSFSYLNWPRPDGTCAGQYTDWSEANRSWSPERPYHLDLPPTRIDEVGTAGMRFERSVVRKPDGSLLATVYGHLAGDTKYRCAVVRSTDEGLHWSFVSTIAYNPDSPGEGFCEPVLAQVADGSLLAVMRSGSGTYPMYQCRSLDGGQTWGTPESLGVFSVDPDLCLMRNGSLACSFGRPTVNLMFSLDGSGRSWTEPTTIFAGNSTCYTGLREISPGRLLLAYDSNPEGSPWQAGDNQVNVVFVEV